MVSLNSGGGVGGSASSSSSALASVSPMTPGLPGGVLSNGQQLQLGVGSVLSLPASTVAALNSIVQQAANAPPSAQQTLVVGAGAPGLPPPPATASPSEHLLGLVQHQHQLGVSAVPETLSIAGEAVDVQDPTAVSQLIGHMGGFEGDMGSELLQVAGPQGGGGLGDVLPGGGAGGVVLGQHGGAAVSVDKLPGFQSFHSLISTDGSLSLPSSTTARVALDSIKQDVMLSSAIHSAPHTLGLGDHPSDRLLGSLDEVPNAAPIKTPHSELKRRLSADLESSRKAQSSSSSLTITSLLNKGPAFAGHLTKKAGDGSGNAIPAPTGRVRMRSKSGDLHKLMRSKSVDHSLMRQRSNTEESVYRSRKRSGDETFIGRSKSHGEDYLSQSDGAGVFRNPSSLPSPFKIKRKHRPSPLFIPPTLSSFQSRLRSPRPWDNGEGKGKGHTPPPYTPPPMLSPIRSGSGLFWSMQGARPLTPQSAPVSARLSLSRRGEFVCVCVRVCVCVLCVCVRRERETRRERESKYLITYPMNNCF